MSGSSGNRALVQRVVEALDPRVVPDFLRRFGAAAPRLPSPSQQVVLVGHRAAGKTRLLPLIAELLQRPAVDLDEEIARRHARGIRDWVVNDEPGFRAAERETFLALPKGVVVAAGGGFLSHHPDLLKDHLAVLIPLTFETYRERLLEDASRPRLRPDLSVGEELQAVFAEREAKHRASDTVPLADLLRGAVGE